jgi:peptidoglycan/LPS O-acetylase OafA/YrhL
LFASLVFFTLRSKKELNETDYFTFSTSETLRGIAVFFLLIGHFSLFCIEGKQITERAGGWAVIIFLMISGIGLTKGYEEKIDKSFIIKRLKRMFVPVWGALLLFYSIDYLALNKTYPLSKILLSFLGIITTVDSPNGPMWFITFIFINYFIFYFVFKLKLTSLRRCLLMFFCCILVALATNFGRGYCTVFPFAVMIATYRRQIQKFLNHFHTSQPVLYVITFFTLFSLVLIRINDLGLPAMIRISLNLVVPLCLVASFAMGAHLLDTMKSESVFLLFIGSISFEIYLLHFPFMVHYGFIRTPLWIYFLIYAAFVVGISLLFNKASRFITEIIFSKNELKTSK